VLLDRRIHPLAKSRLIAEVENEKKKSSMFTKMPLFFFIFFIERIINGLTHVLIGIVVIWASSPFPHKRKRLAT
jgi:hypothetical protein